VVIAELCLEGEEKEKKEREFSEYFQREEKRRITKKIEKKGEEVKRSMFA